jgi:hypothetical protein
VDRRRGDRDCALLRGAASAPAPFDEALENRKIRTLKLTAGRPFADPEKAAIRLLEHAHSFEPIQDGRIYIEKLNCPFLLNDKGTPLGPELSPLGGFPKQTKATPEGGYGERV